jgi:hypothetical protein
MDLEAGMTVAQAKSGLKFSPWTKILCLECQPPDVEIDADWLLL